MLKSALNRRSREKQHSELKITFEDEIKIREAITIHIDHYVDEMQTKIRVLEQKVDQAAEKVALLKSQEVELLMNLSSEFRQGAYDIVRKIKSK